MSYRGRGGSGSNTPTRNGRGGGVPAGRGRGRGRGNQLNDMTTMSLDYERVNIADKRSAVESQDATSHTNGSSRPENASSNTFGRQGTGHRQTSATDSPQQAASSSYPNRNPSMHYNQGQRRAFKPFNASSSSGFNPYGPQSSYSQQASPYNKSNGFQHQHGRAHTGIGAGNRKPEHLGHDPSLTRPITFVKAVNVMQPTMDKEEHDRLLAKQRLEDLFKSAAGPLSPPISQLAAPALVPLPPATKSEAMSRDASHTSSGSKSSAASKVLSPHTAVFSLPSFLGEHKPTAQYSPGISATKEDNGKGKARAVEDGDAEDAPSFYIDTTGDVNAASAGIAQMSLPRRDMMVPSARNQPQAMEVENAEDDEESETEELFPRRRPAKPAAANGPALSKQELHLPTTSYARTITDDVPIQPTPPVPRLSPEGHSILSNATALTNGRANQAAPSKKAAKKQAKQAAKERKKDRKSGKNRLPSYKQKKIARDADSDLDWGSDGPPASTLKDDYEEAEQSMMSVGISQSSQSSKKAGKQNGRGGGGRKGKLSAVDLAIEDLANSSMRLHDNGDDSDEIGAMSEAELSALRSFAKSMSAGEHLTLDDLDDLQKMREEDAEDDTTDEESDDSVDAEELERLRSAIEGDKYPIYIPKPTDWESDPDDERNTLFKSDDESDADGTSKTAWEEAGRKIMQDTSKTASSESSGSESSTSAKDLVIEAEEEVLMVESDSDDAEEAVEGRITKEADSEEEEEEEEAEEEAEDDEDEDEDEDDMLMRFAKPAKKKRQAPTFESDFFDDLLQAQWLKDKQKKAIRKQEKALQRLEQKPNKSNAKKAKRASAKAKAYDLDDDFDVLGGADLRLSGGKVPEFHKINTDLRDFIDNSGYGEYPLPPMDKKFRYAIHMLADAYNLKSKSRGTGRDRHNVLYRTQQTTTRFANNFKIQKYLSITSTWKSGGSKSYSYEYSKTSTAKRGGAGGNVSRNHEGAVVGEGADKIASDNIGHKMLASMGWTEGMQIGKTGGIHEPLKAIVKTSKAGLGSGWVRYNRGSATPGATEEVLGTW